MSEPSRPAGNTAEPVLVLSLGGVSERTTRTRRYRVHVWLWEHGLRQLRNALVRVRRVA